MIGKLLRWLDGPPAAPEWWPTNPEAQRELRIARSITWDYERFRYHLNRAIFIEYGVSL